MKVYQILKTRKFIKIFNKLDNTIRTELNSLIEKLKTNPYIGKPLHSTWFRELKVKKYRAYYIIYEDKVEILMIGISDKKGQQKEIELIKKTFIQRKI